MIYSEPSSLVGNAAALCVKRAPHIDRDRLPMVRRMLYWIPKVCGYAPPATLTPRTDAEGARIAPRMLMDRRIPLTAAFWHTLRTSHEQNPELRFQSASSYSLARHGRKAPSGAFGVY